HVSGDVLPETLKLRRGPFEEGAHPTIVGGEEENDASLREVALESVEFDTAPVRVIGAAEWERRAVVGSRDGLRDTGVSPVRADDDLGFLRDNGPASRPPANTLDPIAVPEKVAHRESVPELGPGRDGRIGEQHVEDGTARRVRLGNAIQRRRGAEEAD